MGKSKKKRSVLNVEKAKEELLNSMEKNCETAIRNEKTKEEIVVEEAKQNDKGFNGETKLSKETDTLHSMLTNSCADNNVKKCPQGIDEGCSAFFNRVAISLDEENQEYFPPRKTDSKESDWKIEGTSPAKIQERNVDENDSESNLTEICDETKDINASKVMDNPSVVVHDVETTEQDFLKMHGAESIQHTQVSEAQISEKLNMKTANPDF
ncbi:hypothetical protein LOAG_12720 [Loa loa]|uniref:Uncharacterized protein n=1 Tax=Loa loa TaxID=7209 RepID=A0A1S0TKS2_LOALO|nr:hypothetical protein LOAG_12720 [Loa loa]EFO15789.1 hypothetical protein LOAG_12720 [Loa loa]